MIQPAAPSLLAPAPVRSFPRQADGAAAFVLSGEGGDPAAPLAGALAGGENRQDDAAPGNPLPTDFALDAGETLAPVIPLPSAPIDPAARPTSTPAAPRSPKFERSLTSLPSFRRAPEPASAERPVERSAYPDRDDQPAQTDGASAMPAPPSRPDDVISTLAAPVATTETPPLSPDATIVAAPVVDRSAPLRVEDRQPEPRVARSLAPMSARPAPPARTPGTPPSMLPASALATSSLTPLDARTVASTEPPSEVATAADGATPVIVPKAEFPARPHRIPADAAADPVRHPATSSLLPVGAEQATSAGSLPALPSAASSQTAVASGAPIPQEMATLLPTRPPVVRVPAGVPDAVARPIDRASSVFPRIASPPPSTVVTATPAQATLPTNWQWAPRAAAVPEASTPSAGASAPLTVPAAPATAPVARPLVEALPSTAFPNDATIAPPAPAEKRSDTPTVMPLAIPAASVAPPAAASPAAIVFGAARFAAQVADDRDEPAAPLNFSSLAGPQAIERAVGVSAATQAPLDMRQEHWPHAMIDRIEMIRDAVDAVDTRIRLVPDALGAIDVEVKRDGDTLNVRFHAEQAQTRTLLADAAPRLAEAAEARGLRLGQNSVGADAGSASQGQQRQPLPAAPPRAPRSPVADAHAADDDTRLA